MLQRRKVIRVGVAATSVPFGVILAVTNAMAQVGTATTEAQAKKNAQSATGGLEELVVTAQRREERLQDVPIAISAFSGDKLDELGVTSVNELSIVTPGLTMTQQRNGLTPFLRGIGTVSASGAEEGTVPVYLDGILVPRLTGTAFSFPNIERIEVLKGPQGTLFGRNSVGGLVNVITRDPSHESSGSVSLQYANYETIAASGYATGGISDDVAMDIVAYSSQQGKGWGRNLNYGLSGPQPGVREDSFYRNETLLRSKVLITPSAAARITLAADYSVQENTVGIERGIYPGSRTLLGVSKQGGYWDSQIAPSTDPHLTNWGASGRLEYDMGFASLTSTTSFRSTSERFIYDQDATAAKLVSAPEIDDADTWQQEVLLTHSDGGLSYTVGLFYYHSNSFYDSDITSEVRPPVNFRTTTTQKTDSYAAFAQTTYRLDSGTSFTTGLRYTKDKRTLDALQTTLTGHPLGAGVVLVDRNPDVDPTAELNESRPTWRVSIDQNLGRDTLLYVSYNRGFKSGVFSQTGGDVASPAVKPEKLDAYEVGLKSDLADRVRLNLSAFYYDYSNTQLTRQATGAVVNFNAPGSKVQGIDAELNFAPQLSEGDLQITLSGAYLHGRYKDFPEAPFSIPLPNGGNTVVSGDASDNVTIRTPTFSGSATASYSVPTQAGEFRISAIYFYSDKFYWEVDNRLAQDAYSLVNAELSWKPLNSKWSFAAFARNIGNTEYSVYTTGGTNGDLYAPAAPRTSGVSAEYSF